jgi:hypothetical protein
MRERDDGGNDGREDERRSTPKITEKYKGNGSRTTTEDEGGNRRETNDENKDQTTEKRSGTKDERQDENKE